MTAPSEWALFSTNATASASGAVSDLTGHAASLATESSSSSDEPSSSLDESFSSSDETFGSSDESPTSSSESASPSNQPAVQSNTSAIAPIISDPTSHQPGTLAALPSLVIDQPNSTTNHVDPPTPTLPDIDANTPSVLPATTDSSPPTVPKPEKVVTGRPHTRAGLPDSSPSNGSKGVDPLSPPVLAGAKDLPEWMEKKGTLDYFRNTFKLGKLSDVIEHWFELERLLGFRKSVGISPLLRAIFIANDIQTPAGFPIKQRPPVVTRFYKDAHNYSKDYGLEVHTLGRQITTWWSEICPPDEEPKVHFGGPTGISTFVVLLSWWCSQLRGKPNREQASCLSILEDLDRVLLDAINNIKNPSVSVVSTQQSQATPSRSRKRANTGNASRSQKRVRSG